VICTTSFCFDATPLEKHDVLRPKCLSNLGGRLHYFVADKLGVSLNPRLKEEYHANFKKEKSNQKLKRAQRS
jgi:hypothetical protein